MDARVNHAAAVPMRLDRPARRRTRRPRVLAQSGVRPAITHEHIAQRAYEIYLARGDGEDDALGDWLAAERQLLAGSETEALTPGTTEPDRYH